MSRRGGRPNAPGAGIGAIVLGAAAAAGVALAIGKIYFDATADRKKRDEGEGDEEAKADAAARRRMKAWAARHISACGRWRSAECTDRWLALSAGPGATAAADAAALFDRAARIREEKIDRQIERDVPRTFPTIAYFQAGSGAGRAALAKVLRTYAVLHRGEGGIAYVQGMNFVAGNLLLHTGEAEALALFYRLCHGERYQLAAVFEPGLPLLLGACAALDALVARALPRVAAHLERVGLRAMMYAQPWFLSLFTYHAMPPQLSAHVWTLFFKEGWPALFRVALALIRYAASDAGARAAGRAGVDGGPGAFGDPPSGGPLATQPLEGCVALLRTVAGAGAPPRLAALAEAERAHVSDAEYSAAALLRRQRG